SGWRCSPFPHRGPIAAPRRLPQIDTIPPVRGTGGDIRFAMRISRRGECESLVASPAPGAFHAALTEKGRMTRALARRREDSLKKCGSTCPRALTSALFLQTGKL